MGFGNNAIQNYYSEDLLQTGITGRPTRHQHYALFPKADDPWYIRWAATRDAFSQHDWDARHLFMYMFKGGIFAGVLGATHYAHSATINVHEMNKARLFSKNAGVLGPAMIAKKYFTKYFSVGAFVGAAYYLWFYQYCTSRGHDNSIKNYILGNAAFVAGLAACFHPRMAGYGFMAGTLYGITSHTLFFGNNEIGNDSERGQVYEIPGLTEQQRQKIKQRDLVAELSWNQAFKQGKFEKI